MNPMILKLNKAWLYNRSKTMPFAAVMPIWWKPTEIEEAGFRVCCAVVPAGIVDLDHVHRIYVFETEEERNDLLDSYSEAQACEVLAP